MCKFVNNTKHSRIDKCMIELIKNLEQIVSYADKDCYKIVACCCGHEKYPMSIIMQWGVKDCFMDIVSGAMIPRKRNFYTRDKDGMYYIPEALRKEDLK